MKKAVKSQMDMISFIISNPLLYSVTVREHNLMVNVLSMDGYYDNSDKEILNDIRETYIRFKK
tara:strand:+ start:190 stop:378 length:189 start_codon:yes stop_codon:yes gene_type:complete